MKKLIEFIRDAFSEDGTPSSKRIIGGLGLAGVHIGWLYGVVSYGFTNELTTIATTLVVADSGLLGITSITNAVKSFGSKTEEEK